MAGPSSVNLFSRLKDDRSASIAVEMASATAFMVIALIGFVEAGIAKTQESFADHGYAVFGELVMSHEGPITCSDLDGYFRLAQQAYATGNIGNAMSAGDAPSPFALRVAGIEVLREGRHGRVEPKVMWHAHYDVDTDFALDETVSLPDALENESDFYILLEGRTRISSAFSFLVKAADELLIEREETRIITPRYQTKMIASGSSTTNCRI